MAHRKDDCPECGATKGAERGRCRTCAGLARRTAEHGTESRYFAHRRDGDPPCPACLTAHSVAEANRARARSARRRREREARRERRRTCPTCGGPKSEKAKVCRNCVDHSTRRKGRARHGTDAGYYRHIRQSGSPAPGWPRTPCDDCRAAHTKANRDRGQQPRVKAVTRAGQRKTRVCRDCGTPVSDKAERCRRCARLHHIAQQNDLPIRWRRVGLIWKAA